MGFTAIPSCKRYIGEWYVAENVSSVSRFLSKTGQILSIGLGCIVVSVKPEFRTRSWRPFRAGMFTAMGLSAVFPVLHGLLLHGMEQMNNRIGLSWLVMQGYLYVLGAGIYAVCFICFNSSSGNRD